MEDNIYLLSYLRKGLSQYIKDNPTNNSSRASIDFSIEMEGKKVSSGSNLSTKFSTGRTLSIVGPADIKQMKPSIISHFYPPAIKTQRFNSSFMPYMEFYESDFPWRYTPLPVSDDGQCAPWLVLVAVADDEFKIVTKGRKKKVVFNLSEERYQAVFPSQDLHSKLAHVQLEEQEDEEGISRLLCGSELLPGRCITVFLLPAFETGRRSALDEDYAGVALGELSWTGGAREFPVYYYWSYYTEDQAGTFETLANKLDMTLAAAYNTIKANLTVDIAESGLANDGLEEVRGSQEEYVIDVPAALNLAMGDQMNGTLREEEQQYRDSLKDELLLNPVFIEIKGQPVQNEDPWVVPPVYGARHLLSKKEDLDGDGVVPEVNLTLRHRIAAGMGVSVVKENQESFVHRAWQKVEKINELNQELREFFEMKEVEQKAKGRLGTKVSLPDNRRQLVYDALPRTLNSSKLTRNRVSVGDVYRAANGTSWKPVQNLKRIIGITPDELQYLFSPNTWETLIDSEEFNEQIANQIIEKYKQENNWMQYFLMPYYNKATDPQKRDICSVNPMVYTPTQNHFFNSSGFGNLYACLHGYIPMESLTLNDYCNLAMEGVSQKSIFTSYYNADSGSRINEAVYPVRLSVKVGKVYYNGYIMDADLFKKKFQGKPFVAFEYYEKSDASVSNNKKYTFLFPSDYENLRYTKFIQYSGEEQRRMVWFKYEKDKYIIALSNNNWDSYYYDEDYCFWDASVLKTIGYLVDKTKAKADPNNPNRVYVEHKGKKFYIDADDSMGITRQGEKVIMNKGVFHDKMIALYINLFYLSNHWLSSPEEAFIELDSFNDYDENIVRMSNSGFELDIEDSVKKQNYVKLKDRLSELGEDKLKIKFITPVPEEPPMGTPNLDEEKERTIDELIKKYGYTEAAQVEDIKRRVENNGLMKYPVMVYPDFLDPTFFYLRELSENYIVPSAGELTKNSVTMFQSNPAFEEAFLVGMNTEMGQELLWREYPTDQRGSYFRKFWVAAKLPEKSRLETDYYDIKKVHDWNQRLGNNHVKPNAQMLVFAIKGELMQAYPKTTIYLSSYDGQTIEMMAEASMTAWLTEDTYLVGFEGFTAQAVRGLFLTFQEDVTALQFAYVDKDTASTFQDSVVLAKTQINTPSVFLLPINN